MTRIVFVVFSTLILSLCVPEFPEAPQSPAADGVHAPHSSWTASESELNTLSGVVMEVIEVAEDRTGLRFSISNNCEHEVTFGSYYYLERKVGDSWELVPYLPQEYDIGWTAEGYSIPPGTAAAFEPLTWVWLYGELEPGDYRIIKNTTTGRAETLQTYWCSAEFTLV